ncbi:MAG: hypothetical protein NC416_10265 [Eubacterium sp.]|nr:hypothetical protein [Eubacterium sp.]
MRAKWRKVIWAILALQLLLWHILFLEKNMTLDYLANRFVNHFNLPYLFYLHWRKLTVFIWMISALSVMALHYWNYMRFRRACINQLSIVTETDIRNNLSAAAMETGLHTRTREKSFLYRSGEIREPFLIGFREPILILPDREYSAQVLHFIFLHECCHIRHRDMLYKLFMLFVQSLLWFCPLIYLIKAVSYQDVEVACDEAVVEGKDMSARKEYGHALLECLKMERVKGQAYSTYFYHGKQMMKARIAAIMKEDKKWDFLAYCGIGILLLDASFNFYRIGNGLYERYLTRKQEELAEISFYDGYELPDGFTQGSIDEMIKFKPVSEDAYYNEWVSEDAYEWKEYADLPFESEGPWQVRVRDADKYSDSVLLLLQRYVSYFDNPDAASQWISEGSWYSIAESVYSRLLAGDKNEAVFSIICKYYIGYEENELTEFPQELKDHAQIAQEKDGYYAYFDWALRIRMVKDYVFELEGIAETEDVLQAYMAQYAQADFADIPKLDLIYEVEKNTYSSVNTEENVSSPPATDNTEENASLSPADNHTAENISLSPAADNSTAENAYQVTISNDALQVCNRNGIWMTVPITLEELFTRGDEMDGKLSSLQPGSYQIDENKIIFAYGGDTAIPFSVIFYDEESQSFKKSVVTNEFCGGRKIYVDFPENAQEGFLIFTGERVVWQEMTTLFHTQDGGKSWQYMGLIGSFHASESHSLTTGAVFINNRVGFLTIRDSNTPEIWRTQDGGKSWKHQELADVPEYYTMAYAPEMQDGILCLYIGMEEYSEYGGTKAKYESADEGATWEYKGLVIRK